MAGVAVAQDARYSSQALLNEIVITRSENENAGDGTFRWASETSDGTRKEQNGFLKAGPDHESPIQVIQGGFSYISPEGQQIDLSYIADENGFQPQGVHLPGLPIVAGRAVDTRPVQPISKPVVQAQQPRYVETTQTISDEEYRRRVEEDNRRRLEDSRTAAQRQLAQGQRVYEQNRYQPRPVAPRTSYTQPKL